MSNNIKIDPIISNPINNSQIQWFETFGLSDYDFTINKMENIVKNIIENNDNEKVWVCEHTPLFTTGSSSMQTNNNIDGIPVFNTRRGGKDTYHGTGQLTFYLMINIQKRHINIKDYIRFIADININVLKDFGINAFFDASDVGVWVKTKNGQDKIAAIGVKIRKGVSFYGFGFNINPCIENFHKIIPCGINKNGYGTTSLEKLGINTTKNIVIDKFIQSFEKEIQKISKI